MSCSVAYLIDLLIAARNLMVMVCTSHIPSNASSRPVRAACLERDEIRESHRGTKQTAAHLLHTVLTAGDDRVATLHTVAAPTASYRPPAWRSSWTATTNTAPMPGNSTPPKPAPAKPPTNASPPHSRLPNATAAAIRSMDSNYERAQRLLEQQNPKTFLGYAQPPRSNPQATGPRAPVFPSMKVTWTTAYKEARGGTNDRPAYKRLHESGTTDNGGSDMSRRQQRHWFGPRRKRVETPRQTAWRFFA
jgi:hypothetical protein